MNNYSSLIDINKCTGCSACYVECKNDAISIVVNKQGFYSSFVDNLRCIECKKCKSVCPATKTFNAINFIEKPLLGVCVKDEELLNKCSSGGVASAIYEYSLDKGYYIIGAIYNQKNGRVEGKLSKSKSDIKYFRSSKYLQCDFSHAFKKSIELAKDDKNNKFVVIALPCQIAGIAALIREHNIKEQFILIDMYCHGVPSYLIWDIYCNSIMEKNNERPQDVNFRSKKFGWGIYCLSYKLNNDYYYKLGYSDKFYKMFFGNRFLNTSCYKCTFRKQLSYADLRIGDYWGKRFIKNTKGVSACTILTDNGSRFFTNIRKSLFVLHEEKNSKELIELQCFSDYKPAFNIIKDLAISDNINIDKFYGFYKQELQFSERVIASLKSIIAKSPKLTIWLRYIRIKFLH